MVIGPSGVSITLTHTNAGALGGGGESQIGDNRGASVENAVYLGGGSKFENLVGIVGGGMREGVVVGTSGGTEIGCNEAICRV